MAEFIGRTLGDFVVRSRLGEGGGGEVFLAEQLTLAREAVIKVLRRNELTPEAADRFLREARLASRLDHPFAAHLYAFGAEPDGTLWIAMEHVRGTPLDKLIRAQGPVTVARFVPFFERLCEVVNAAHDQGIIHRDIKPANVMVLGRAGRLLPKLLDLGIARMAGAAELTVNATEGAEPPVFESASVTSRLLKSEALQLTRVGVVVGTPHFMSPEQWADASSADARSDIYALAILAYQALTGRLPFEGKSVRALARAHATAPLPPLENDLPQALWQVLSRGAAKAAADRYPSALEFGAAVRAASGLGKETAALPQLEEDLRANWLSEAPQPLAEAVAALESARTAAQAVEAAHAILTVVTRYLGVLALAARAGVGSGGAGDSPEVKGLLETLARDRLTANQWWSLTRALVSPFAKLRDAHPLPELVDFCSRGSGGLERALAMVWPGPEAAESDQQAFLLSAVPSLGQVLASLSFVLDYPLVVQRDASERWMGTRRGRRLVQPVAGASVSPGEVVLLDEVGSRVQTLSPLLQLISPGGQAPDELFFFDGAGRHGARMVALPGVFERHDPGVWTWLARSGLYSAEVATAQAVELAPYKGLSTFTAADADNYFGRELEAETFANRLRQDRLLAVVGPSGAGKSSFVLAGVLPLLPDSWRPLVMRPGSTPISTLLSRLASAGIDTADLATDLSTLPVELAARLERALPDGRTLVVVVDQFEELVTLCHDVGERELFAKTLAAAADSASGRLRLVMTLRDDFLIKVQQVPAFRSRLSNALQLLGTPSAEDLLRVVVEPARRVGYGFDDAQLPQRMVEAVAEYPGALALLSFTASQLWEHRDRHLRQLRVKAYDALGGVGGALAHHAETTLGRLSGAEQRLAREAFRRLVTSQATRAVLSRKELLEILGDDGDAQRVVEALVNARLLVTSETDSGEDKIEIIHEALIVSWPRLVRWQHEDAETARLRDALRTSAKQWDDRGRPAGLLWRAESLGELKLWRQRFPGRLTQVETDFSAASLREETRARRTRQVLLVTAFVALLVGMAFILRAYRQADASAELAQTKAAEATAQLALLRQEQGRLALLDDKPLEALAYFDGARQVGASGRTFDLMLSAAVWQTRGELLRIAVPAGALPYAISSDRTRAALGNSETLEVVDLVTGEVVFRLAASVAAAAFSGDGRWLVVGSGEGVVLLVDATTGEVQGRIALRERGALKNITIGPTGQFLAVSYLGGGVDTLEVSNGALRVASSSPIGEVEVVSVQFSPDARSMAIIGARGLSDEDRHTVKVRLVDVRSGTLLRRLGEGTEHCATFVADGAHLIVGRLGGVVAAIRVADGKQLWSAHPHKEFVTDIQPSPDGRRLLSVGLDGSYAVLEASTGKEVLKGTLALPGMPFARESGVAWSADGSMFFASLPDGSILKLSATTGTRVWRYFGHHSPVRKVFVDPRRSRLISMGFRGEDLFIWNPDEAFVQKVSSVKASEVFGLPPSTAFIASDGHQWQVLLPDAGPLPVSGMPPEGETLAAVVTPDHRHLVANRAGGVDVFALGDAGFLFQQRLEASLPIDRFAVDATGEHVVGETSGLDLVFWSGKPLQQTGFVSGAGHALSVGVFASRGQQHWSGDLSGTLSLRSSVDGHVIRSHKGAHRNYFAAFPFQLSDTFFTYCNDNSLGVWVGDEPLRLGTISGFTAGLLLVTLDHSREVATLWFDDGTVGTWAIRKNQRLTRMDLGFRLKSIVVSEDTGFGAAEGVLVRFPVVLGSPSAAEIQRAVHCRSYFALRDESLHVRTPEETAPCVGQAAN